MRTNAPILNDFGGGDGDGGGGDDDDASPM